MRIVCGAMGSSCSKLVVCLCWEKVASWFNISTARKISLTYELGWDITSFQPQLALQKHTQGVKSATFDNLLLLTSWGLTWLWFIIIGWLVQHYCRCQVSPPPMCHLSVLHAHLLLSWAPLSQAQPQRCVQCSYPSQLLPCRSAPRPLQRPRGTTEP